LNIEGKGEMRVTSRPDRDAAARWVAARYLSLPEEESVIRVAISVGWHGLVNLFVLALAFCVFASVATPFETIVVALLAMMWAASRSALSVLVHFHQERFLPDSRRYCRLLELLKDPEYVGDDAKQRTKDDHHHLATQLNRAERITLIYEIGWTALFLLALYKLLAAVLPSAQRLIHG
jgi:hypothetical protein